MPARTILPRACPSPARDPQCRRAWLRALRLFAVAILPLIAAMPPAWAAEPEPWGVDGEVFSTARIGGTLYVGGAFRNAGPCTGGGVPIDPISGVPIRPF